MLFNDIQCYSLVFNVIQGGSLQCVFIQSLFQAGLVVGGFDNVLVTSASKGIIQRDHQNAALFYKNYTLGNPFENVTKDELENYRREIERKNNSRGKGESLSGIELPSGFKISA